MHLVSHFIFPVYLGAEVTSTPTRPVENVVITTKSLQDRNNLLLDGRTVENKGKLILTEMIFKSIDFLFILIDVSVILKYFTAVLG